MEITKQYSENECGVCVINSFVKYFYHQDKKLEIFSDADLSESGMSLFEFEQLGKRHGLAIESFELEFKDFLQNYDGKYCATLIKGHFLIIQKKFNWVTVYDSSSPNLIRYSIDEFKKIFSNILIEVSKSTDPQPSKNFSKHVIDNLNSKIFILLIFAETLFFSLSMISAKFFSFLIEWCIVPSNLSNGFFITILFVFLLILSALSFFIKNIISNKILKNKSEELFFISTSKIKYKISSFYKKINKNDLFSLETIILGVANFLSIEIPFFVANIIFAIVAFVILVSNNFYFLIPIMFLISFATLITFYEIKNKKLFLSTGIKNHNNTYEFFAKYINKSNFSNISNINNVYFESNKLNFKAKNFSCLISTAFFFLETLFSLFCSFMCCYFISMNTLNISTFIFLTSIMSIFIHCIFSTFSFFSKKNEFNIFKDIFEKIINTDNVSEESKIKLPKTMSINFQNPDGTYEKINNISKVSPAFIAELLDPHQSSRILVNNKELKNFSHKNIMDRTIFFRPYQTIDINLDSLKNMPKIFFEIIHKSKIDLTPNKMFAYSENILINFLMLLNFKNKIIVIDYPKHLLKNNKFSVEIKSILKTIKKSNFILFY